MKMAFEHLPTHWRRARVDRVASVNARIGWKALTAAEYQVDGVVFLSTPNINTEAIDFDNVNYIPEWRYEESPELKLKPGDVLLAKDGTLGITNLVQSLPRPATVNGSIAVVRPRSVDSRFLRFVLASAPTQGQIAALKAGMGVPHLFQWDINRLSIPVPPRQEQRAIADFLDAETARIDALIANKGQLGERLSERLTSTRNAMMSSDAGIETGIPSLPAVPRSWHVLRNKVFLTEVDDRSVSGEEELLTVSHLSGVTPRSEKTVYMFEAESTVGYKRVHPGDLVINTMWAWMGAAGVSRHHGIVSPAYGVYRFDSETMLPDFYDVLVRSPGYIEEMTRYSKGVWTSRLRLYPDEFLRLFAPVPPIEVQHELANHFHAASARVLGLTDRLERQTQLLHERRQALITAAVTGEIEVPGAA